MRMNLELGLVGGLWLETPLPRHSFEQSAELKKVSRAQRSGGLLFYHVTF